LRLRSHSLVLYCLFSLRRLANTIPPQGAGCNDGVSAEFDCIQPHKPFRYQPLQGTSSSVTLPAFPRACPTFAPGLCLPLSLPLSDLGLSSPSACPHPQPALTQIHNTLHSKAVAVVGAGQKCGDFQRGQCVRGSQCKFVHDGSYLFTACPASAEFSLS
jgi:hypothetical protein